MSNLKHKNETLKGANLDNTEKCFNDMCLKL